MTTPKEGLLPGMIASIDSCDPEPLPGDLAVAARDVDFYYGSFHALQSVSLGFARQRVTALIGPSGCGKSTFLRCLNRMNDLIDGSRLTGSVALDGEDIYDRRVDVMALRKKVGMIFQKPNPFPMSVFDNIAYGPRIHGVRGRKELEARVERTLTQAALWDEVKDKLKQSALALSGGQQQRLCIARALAVEPEVLLMDEPCSALDPNSTHRIEELIGQLKQRYTVAIVTHNLQQATRVADYTAFFLRGKMVEMGTTSQVFSAPCQSETSDYVHGRFG